MSHASPMVDELPDYVRRTMTISPNISRKKAWIAFVIIFYAVTLVALKDQFYYVYNAITGEDPVIEEGQDFIPFADIERAGAVVETEIPSSESYRLSALQPIGVIKHTSSFDDVLSLLVNNRHAYIATFNQTSSTSQINIVDLTIPSKPRASGVITLDSAKIHCMDLSDEYLIVAARDVGQSSAKRNIKILLYKISEKDAPALISNQVLSKQDCTRLRIIDEHAYLINYKGTTSFTLPSMQTTKLFSNRLIQDIQITDTPIPLAVLIEGQCSGKWGCTTYVESAPLPDLLSGKVGKRKKIAGHWFSKASTKDNKLFLTNTQGLIVQKLSESSTAAHLCTVISNSSTMAPFKSGIHFIGSYGIHLSGNNDVATIDFTDISYPIQGSIVEHSVSPLEMATEENKVYILDQKRLTVYEAIWEKKKPKIFTTGQMVTIQMTRIYEEKYQCEEEEVQLVDEREVEALLAIHNDLSGQEWRYTGQTWDGKSYSDYQYMGPWPISSITQDGKTIQLAENAAPCSWTGVTCSCDGHIIGVSLSLRNVQGNIPPEIKYLTHLESLNLSHTGPINSIPPEMGQLTSLRRLSFSHKHSVPSEVELLPNICIVTDYDGVVGPGCDALFERKIHPGCTYK